MEDADALLRVLTLFKEETLQTTIPLLLEKIIRSMKKVLIGIAQHDA